ncbi:MAG: tetratricopeptide repeat protein [Chitinophagales bacterium]
MVSKKWIIAGSAGLLLVAAVIYFSGDRIFNSHTGSETINDSLQMIEQLTPQIADLSERIKKSPTDAGLFYTRANEYLEYGNLKFALEDYKKAYQLDSTNATYALGLSDGLFQVNNADGAIGVLLDFLKTDPDNEDVLVELGLDYLYLPEPEYKKSLEAFDKVIKINVQNADAYFYKGIIFKETGDTVRALSSFQTTIEVDPDYYSAYMQLGTAYAESKDPIALKYFDIAISLNDTSNEAQYAKAKYYQDNGKIAEAIKYYRGMITKNPQDDDAIYNLATIYFGIDSIGAAYKYYDLAIKQAPARAMSYYGKGLCAEELKRVDEAISLYNQALNLDPDLKIAEEQLLKLKTNKK